MRPDIAPGGTFPDYELPDHYRPKEHRHLELAAFYPDGWNKRAAAIPSAA